MCLSKRWYLLGSRKATPSPDPECQMLAHLQLQYCQNYKIIFSPVAEDGVNFPASKLKLFWIVRVALQCH